MRALLVVPLALLLAACSAEPPASAPDAPTATLSSSASAAAPRDSLVPAVMLGSTIRTSQGQIRTGIDDPATFVQTRRGFVVQDTTGTTYAVEAGVVRELGAADPVDGLALLVDTTGTLVAWVSPTDGGWTAQVYDASTGRRLPDVALEGPRPVLDDRAVYEHLGDRVLRHPVEDGPTTTTRVPAGSRLVAVTAGTLELTTARTTVLLPVGGPRSRTVLRPPATLSPTGRYAVTTGGAIRVTEVVSGTDVTPDVSSAASRPLWTGPDTFTVITDSAPLISPPDSVVFHVDECTVTTGRCDNVVQVVTGQALSVVGLPVGSSYPRR